MTEPVWLTLEDVIAVHGEQQAIFGGPEGIRDTGLLESALTRPINRWNYGTTDLSSLAAAYAYGLARNHPFVDGNKRAAFAAMIVFLRINDIRFAPDPAQASAAMLDLAAGELNEDEFARWIRDNWPGG